MASFLEFLKRLLSLRNLAPFLIIVGAIVGSLDLHPFGIQFQTNQIVLALLAFLAIDSMVERLDLLANIEHRITSLQQIVNLKTNTADLIKRRQDFPRLEQIIDKARYEIWVTGVTLDAIITMMSLFEAKLLEGCNLRFMALDPSGKSIDSAARYYGNDAELSATRIRANLTYLASRLQSTDKGSVEIRVLDQLFPSGYIAIDPNDHAGQMLIQLYLYHIDSEIAPILTISKEDGEQWFSLYMLQLEKAWNDARVFSEPSTSRHKDSAIPS